MSEPIPQPGVQFSVNDRGGEYYTKLQQLAAAVDLSITAYNAAVAAGTDASGYLQQIQELQAGINQALAAAIEEVEAIRDSTQAIAEGDLPAQAGNKNKVLTTSGSGIGWSYVSGFNRYSASAIELEAGDEALITAAEELVITMPLSISQGDPFYIRNSSASTADIVLHTSFNIITPPGKPNIEAGDTVRIPPGTPWPMLALSEDTLELIV